MQLFCCATQVTHICGAQNIHSSLSVLVRAFPKICDLWGQAIDQKKNVVITCVGEVGNGLGTLRNNFYDRFSRFNTLLGSSLLLETPFQALALCKTCRKRVISNATQGAV